MRPTRVGHVDEDGSAVCYRCESHEQCMSTVGSIHHDSSHERDSCRYCREPIITKEERFTYRYDLGKVQSRCECGDWMAWAEDSQDGRYTLLLAQQLHRRECCGVALEDIASLLTQAQEGR
jgi:hypothetical protein